MKKILLLTAAVLISGSAMAQHEHFHVFRNDNQFNTFNNVQEITYQGSPSSGYNKMQVTDAKGNATIIDIEAIDSVVVRPIGIPEFHVNLTDYPEWTELIGSKSEGHAGIYQPPLLAGRGRERNVRRPARTRSYISRSRQLHMEHEKETLSFQNE